MTETEIINRLINTSDFKELQTLGLTIHDNQRQFDLLSVYKELIDEMAIRQKDMLYLNNRTLNNKMELIIN